MLFLNKIGPSYVAYSLKINSWWFHEYDFILYRELKSNMCNKPSKFYFDWFIGSGEKKLQNLDYILKKCSLLKIENS